MSDQDLLIEIGLEELPPNSVASLGEGLRDGLSDGLTQAGFAHAAVDWFAAPRRLAVVLKACAAKQADREVEKLGPALDKAYNGDGQPTPAAQGFARSCGVELDQLGQKETDKGTRLYFASVEPGRELVDVLPEVLLQALKTLPIKKRMRWGDHPDEFVRPVHWLVALHGTEVLPLALHGISAGNATRGHRFHHPEALVVPAPADYEQLLRDQGKVIADFDTRKAAIKAALEQAAAERDLVARIDADLLDEVTGLVDWPEIVVGAFDPAFLELPEEVLVSTLQEHQRYFPLRHADGSLSEYFATVSNILSRQPDIVRQGNERVVRPRLSDAKFFWDTDLKTPLDERTPALDAVVFQKDLGSLGEKTARVAALANSIAEHCGFDTASVARAATLSRCDLVTEMVGEFPELQGTMGSYYAARSGESKAVATAVGEFYQPRFAGDATPASDAGIAIAVADRLDSIAGLFAIGRPPTGDKDPFGLRRAALGVQRTLIERELNLDLAPLVAQAVALQNVECDQAEVTTAMMEFLFERLRRYFLDDAVESDVFQAVYAMRPGVPADFAARIGAVQQFVFLPEAGALAAANKRIRNILRQAENETRSESRDALTEPAELALMDALDAAERDLAPLATDYSAQLKRLAQLRDPVDAFFDGVMVMAEDAGLRAARLGLLERMRQVFSSVADIGELRQGSS